MDQIVSKLAEHTGVDAETAHKAVGAVVSFLQAHLPADLSSQLMKVLPGSEAAVSRFEGADPSVAKGGGLVGTVTSLAGAVLGGKLADSSKLLEMLGKSGLDMTQIKAFLPKALELLKDHVPPEIYEKIKDLGGVGAAAEKA